MKKLITTFAVCLSVGVGASAMQQAQDPPPAQAQKPPTQEITLTGCLIQGTTPTVFIFDKARKDPKSPTEKAVKYVVVPTAADLSLRPHLNHEVQIVGVWDGRTAPAGDKVEEKDLPRFTAKSVTMVADTCTPAAR
ncbi:MAG TPA: hypothetical protein VMS54_08765 [Vicinamibacterales bacterium]|nr:hypothetical protein [Vicinamibacterales bacterium]